MKKLQIIKEGLKKNLYENLIPFWDQMIDKKEGGFYGEWETKPVTDSDKGSVYLSRLLWSFSKLYQKDQNEKILCYCNDIFKFLSTYMYDFDNKGFFWSVAYNGKVKNNHKHLYAQSFCLYGLSEYYRITKDSKCMEIIDDLLEIINDNLIDFPNNYCEERLVNLNKTENALLVGYGMIPEITTNTLLHLAESLGTCYDVLKNSFIKELCLKVIDIIFKYGYDYNRNSLIQFLDYQLKPACDVVSYGHDIEVSWLMNDVLDKLELEKSLEKYRNILNDLGTFALQGFNGNYLFLEKINGTIINHDIIWWVQAESLIYLLMMYEKTNENDYLDKMMLIYETLEKAIITKDEWLWAASKDYMPLNYHNQAEMWKANYHNIRCILKFLEERKV